MNWAKEQALNHAFCPVKTSVNGRMFHMSLPSVHPWWGGLQHVQPQWTTGRGDGRVCHCYKGAAWTRGAGGHFLGLNYPALQRNEPKWTTVFNSIWQKHNDWQRVTVCVCVCARPPHVSCWWRLCKVPLSAVGWACLEETPSAAQPHRGHCAPRPGSPPSPGQTPLEAGWHTGIIRGEKYEKIFTTEFIQAKRKKIIPGALSSWNFQLGKFQLCAALTEDRFFRFTDCISSSLINYPSYTVLFLCNPLRAIFTAELL